MMKLETNWQQDIIPDFDVLKWKQETQAEILRETEGMTREEVREYFRKGSEEFREEQRLRRTKRAALAESANK